MGGADAASSTQRTVAAINLGHDASIAIAFSGVVQAVLELERLQRVRHFESPLAAQPFTSVWREAAQQLFETCGVRRVVLDDCAIVQPGKVWQPALVSVTCR